MKKVMILGAGRGQVGLIKAAKKLNYYTIAASIPGDYPGFEIADEKCYVDIRDIKGITEAAKKYCVDGIVTACMDAGLPALGAACETLGLKGLNKRAAEVSSNKLMMKDAFMRYGVNSAAYVKAESATDLETITQKLNMPVIIKPVDLGGSRGINIVFDEKELESKFRDTMSSTGKKYCIIEEYIDGNEFSATAFVAHGKTLFVLPTGDLRYGENDEIPVGHYVPFECSPAMRIQVEEQVSKAIEAIGIDDCAVNVDIMAKDGKPYILELTGRLGANAIPEITTMYFGGDINELIVQTAVGDYSLVDEYCKTATDLHDYFCYGKMLVSEKSGTAFWNRSAQEKSGVEMFVKNGDKINKFCSPKDCLGQIVVSGHTINDCEDKTRDILSGLELTVKEVIQ